MRMAFDDYDQDGYPMSEFSRNFSRKAYGVPEYDIRSLDDIGRCIREGRYTERLECEDHIRHLEGLQKSLSMISVAEEREGIMNWELREVIDRVRKLLLQLSSLANGLPAVLVYRHNQVSSQPKSAPAKAKLTAAYSEPLM